MMIVGFSGYARTGKDSAAEALASLGFVRISFADVLRNFIYELNPIVVPNFAPHGGSGYRLQTVIDEYGWSGYKQSIFSDDIRRNLQVLGTDCGRAMLGDNVWVDALFKNLNENGKYAIADVRFPNEADGIRAKGGRMYRIERAGIGPANGHFSEIALDHYSFDGFIHNDGSLEHFNDSVRRRILEGRN